MSVLVASTTRFFAKDPMCKNFFVLDAAKDTVSFEIDGMGAVASSYSLFGRWHYRIDLKNDAVAFERYCKDVVFMDPINCLCLLSGMLKDVQEIIRRRTT